MSAGELRAAGAELGRLSLGLLFMFMFEFVELLLFGAHVARLLDGTMEEL